MIIALLRSEWIKFRSYYLALGAALVALVAHTSWGAYLPQPAGELFTATPTSQYANNPLQGLLILGAWLLVIGGMASLRFLKTDLGGRY